MENTKAYEKIIVYKKQRLAPSPTPRNKSSCSNENWRKSSCWLQFRAGSSFYALYSVNYRTIGYGTVKDFSDTANGVRVLHHQ